MDLMGTTPESDHSTSTWKFSNAGGYLASLLLKLFTNKTTKRGQHENEIRGNKEIRV
jgi:hypothetical protein